MDSITRRDLELLDIKVDAQTTRLIEHDAKLSAAWDQVKESSKRQADALEGISTHQATIVSLLKQSVKQSNGPLIRWLVVAVILSALSSKALELLIGNMVR